MSTHTENPVYLKWYQSFTLWVIYVTSPVVTVVLVEVVETHAGPKGLLSELKGKAGDKPVAPPLKGI